MACNAVTTPVSLTIRNHRSVLTQDGIVIVECWASSCGACAVLSPVYEEVAQRYPQHAFAKLDTLAEDELTSTLQIVHVPTLLLFRDGLMLFKQAGNYDHDRLEDIISQAEALDMDLVRAEAAKGASAE